MGAREARRGRRGGESGGGGRRWWGQGGGGCPCPGPRPAGRSPLTTPAPRWPEARRPQRLRGPQLSRRPWRMRAKRAGARRSRRAGPLPVGAAAGPALTFLLLLLLLCGVFGRKRTCKRRAGGRGQRWREAGAGRRRGRPLDPPPAVGLAPGRAPAGAREPLPRKGRRSLVRPCSGHPTPTREASLAAGPSEPFRRGGQGPPWEAGALPAAWPWGWGQAVLGA